MSISTMQQRRPHSTVAIPDGGGGATTTTTREQRRNERRIAKEKRNNYGTKKYRRVKRTTRTTANNNNKLYGIILGKWKNDPYLQITFFTFMLCTIFGISIYRVFHGSNSNSHLDAPAKHKPFQANRASNEYNSDNAGGSLLSKLRGELMLFVCIC